MKLLITGDWHIRISSPVNRIDDFFAAQHRKINWVLDKAIEENCRYILQPGDFYNTWKIPHHLEVYIIGTLKAYLRKHTSSVTIITIFGQHDLRYHSSDRKNTPLSVLEAAKVVTIAKDKPIELIPILAKGQKQIHVHGVSWKEEMKPYYYYDSSNIKRLMPDHHSLPLGINILLMHDLISEEGKGWEKKKTKVHSLFDQTNFDLMVTGDNHKSFAYSDGKRHLINCGSLMRSHIDQAEHEPYVYIYDTETNKMKGMPVPVEPFAVVMNVEKAEKEKKENEDLGAFVSGLKDDIQLVGLDFKNNLPTYMKANKIRKGVWNIMDEVMGGSNAV